MSEQEDGLTQWDVEQLNRLADGGNKNAGQLVETKSGLVGRTKNSDALVNGKVLVYTDKGNLLCKASDLIIKGYID